MRNDLNRTHINAIKSGTLVTADSLPEFLKVQKLDWEVETVQEKHPVTGAPLPFFATMRKDTGEIFQTGFSERYQVAQNAEAFQAIVAMGNQASEVNGGLTFAKAHQFNGGAKVAVTVDMGVMTIGDPKVGDIIAKRVAFSNSHDGTGAVEIVSAPIRLMCKNGMASISQEANVSLRHTSKVNQKLQIIRNTYLNLKKVFAKTEIVYNKLAARKISKKDFLEMIELLFPAKGEKGEEETSTRTNNIKTEIAKLYANADDGKIEQNTGWNLYNSVTRYNTHFSSTRGNNDMEIASNRSKSLLFGSLALKNQKALNIITEALSIDAIIEATDEKIKAEGSIDNILSMVGTN